MILYFYSFDVVWDDRDSAFGELKDYKLLYFLQDDTIAIKVSDKWSAPIEYSVLLNGLFTLIFQYERVSPDSQTLPLYDSSTDFSKI